jgi:hypothetical protein
MGIRWCRVAQPPVTGWHPLAGCEIVEWGLPVVSLVVSSTTGWELSSLRDGEAGEGSGGEFGASRAWGGGEGW